MTPAAGSPVLLIVSRSMPPDVGGYQRQMRLVCPYLRQWFDSIMWVGALRDDGAPDLEPIPGVDRAVRLRFGFLPARMRRVATLGVLVAAIATAVQLRARRRRVHVLLLSPSVTGAPTLVKVLRLLGCPVVARYPTAGDLTDRRGQAVGRSRGVTAVAPSPSQVAEQDHFPVLLVPNAVTVGAPAATSERLRRFLYVGRLVRRKRADVLVDAWRSVASQLPGWELVLVGDGGPDDDSIEEQLRRTAVDGTVPRLRLAGRLADPGPELRSADVFVFPSVREGQPNSVLEALAAGLPVIADPARAADWFDPVPPLLDWSGEDADLGPAMVRASTRSDLAAVSDRSRQFVIAHHAASRTAGALASALRVDRSAMP